MQANKKQVGLLLTILIIPAFLFIFFQLSFKNYYKLPYIGSEGKNKATPVTLEGEAYKIPTKNTFWVVGYADNNPKAEKLFNALMPLAASDDMKTLLESKLSGYQIKYILLSKEFQKNSPRIALDSQVQKTKTIGLDDKNNVLLIDNQGFVRGKYELLSKGNEEEERLATELKVLIEIVKTEEETKNSKKNN